MNNKSVRIIPSSFSYYAKSGLFRVNRSICHPGMLSEHTPSLLLWLWQFRLYWNLTDAGMEWRLYVQPGSTLIFLSPSCTTFFPATYHVLSVLLKKKNSVYSIQWSVITICITSAFRCFLLFFILYIYIWSINLVWLLHFLLKRLSEV